MVKNPPYNARDTSLIPGPGKLSLCATTTEAHVPGARALQQEKLPQWEACALQPEEAHVQQWRPNTAKNLKKKKLVKDINYFKQKLLNLCCGTLTSELPPTNQMMCLWCWRGCLDWSIEKTTDIHPSANCKACAGSKIQSPEPDDPNLQLKDGRSPVLI